MGVVPSQDDAVACELGDVAGDVEPRRVRPADLVVAGVVVEEEEDVRPRHVHEIASKKNAPWCEHHSGAV